MSKGVYAAINRDCFRGRLLKYTRKAFKLLPKLDKPHILDVGCGSGVPTIELARLSKGKVVGIDSDQSILEKLNRKVEREGLSNRVETKKCSMFELDFQDESFDIIWVEGAIQAIGFEKGLKHWRRLLKPHGFLVVHDLIETLSDKREKIPSCGYQLTNQFSLPNNAWWTEFYRPLGRRIKQLRMRYKNDPESLKILEKCQNEIDLVKKYSEHYGSGFYLMQKR